VDNFSTGTLNPALWVVDTGNCPTQPGMTCTFQTGNVDLSQGVLALKLTETAGGGATSTGAEVRSILPYGYGTYSCTMRASSTSATPGGAGSEVSGSVSSCFSFINNSQTEIDSPEFEGQGSPGTLGSCTVGQVCAELTNFNGISNKTNNDIPVASGDTAFHVYTWVWTPGSIIYKLDGATQFVVTTNIPSAPAYVIFNHYGTNSASFGGVAVSGNRWQYVSNFTYTSF
jgi:beta-glucanase (GH16 family)